MIFKSVIKTNKNYFIIKRNIKNAFRNVPMALKHQWLLNFKWQNVYYKETCLLFDLIIALIIFNLFANTFE